MTPALLPLFFCRVLQMLDYNVPGGKLNRGMAVYDVLASIKGDEVRASSCRRSVDPVGATGSLLSSAALLHPDLREHPPTGAFLPLHKHTIRHPAMTTRSRPTRWDGALSG